MFNLFRSKKNIDKSEMFSPVTGTVHPLSECRDGAFSGGALGQGVIFRFEGSYILSPCHGTVVSVAKTNHCVSLLCDNGAELLIHVGFDTVMLASKGLRVLVAKNQRVRPGQRLIELDRDLLSEQQVDLTTPMVVTNHEDIDMEIICSSGAVSATKTVVMKCRAKAEG